MGLLQLPKVFRTAAFAAAGLPSTGALLDAHCNTARSTAFREISHTANAPKHQGSVHARNVRCIFASAGILRKQALCPPRYACEHPRARPFVNLVFLCARAPISVFEVSTTWQACVCWPIHTATTSRVGSAEEVDRAVGRRSEAHLGACRGSRGGRQRRPGVDGRVEAV